MSNFKIHDKVYVIMWQRIIADLFLLISILILPFWVSIISVIIFALYFNRYYELLIAALFIDILYGVEQSRFLYSVSVTFTTGILLLVIIEFLKTKLKFYQKEQF